MSNNLFNQIYDSNFKYSSKESRVFFIQYPTFWFSKQFYLKNKDRIEKQLELETELICNNLEIRQLYLSKQECFNIFHPLVKQILNAKSYLYSNSSSSSTNTTEIDENSVDPFHFPTNQCFKPKSEKIRKGQYIYKRLQPVTLTYPSSNQNKTKIIEKQEIKIEEQETSDNSQVSIGTYIEKHLLQEEEEEKKNNSSSSIFSE